MRRSRCQLIYFWEYINLFNILFHFGICLQTHTSIIIIRGMKRQWQRNGSYFFYIQNTGSYLQANSSQNGLLTVTRYELPDSRGKSHRFTEHENCDNSFWAFWYEVHCPHQLTSFDNAYQLKMMSSHKYCVICVDLSIMMI